MNDNNNNFINTNLSCYWEFRNVKYKYLERILIIQFKKILVYLPANLTAQRPITKYTWPRECRSMADNIKMLYGRGSQTFIRCAPLKTFHKFHVLFQNKFKQFWPNISYKYTFVIVYSILFNAFNLKDASYMDSGLENREYGRGDPLGWPRDALYPQKLALTTPTCGGVSVGIVRLRTKTTEFVFVCSYLDQWEGCGWLFENNLSCRGWGFQMATLRSFSRFIIQRYFVLMAATVEN
jgi:hypothetical protein